MFLILSRIKFMTKQLGLLRTEYYVKFVSKKSMMVIDRMTS
jgi:hypothetical protein